MALATIHEAKTNLSRLIQKAERGEEVLIAREAERPIVKLVVMASGSARLTRHPDLIGSTVTHDPAALIHPLPPEEWGDLY